MAKLTLHQSQERVYNSAARFNFIITGRRWGKNYLAARLVSEALQKGQKVLYVTYSRSSVDICFDELCDYLKELISSTNKTTLRILATTGGTVNLVSYDAVLSGLDFDLVIVQESELIPDIDKKFYTDYLCATVKNNGSIWLFTTLSCKLLACCNTYQIFISNKNNPKYFAAALPTKDNPIFTQEFLAEIEKAIPYSIYESQYLAKYPGFIENLQD